ncbi:MAG: hypothetical protein GX234_03950 [Clostridiales bacterium]|nr:hypothetical protein [Clostridiales bacterium]
MKKGMELSDSEEKKLPRTKTVTRKQLDAKTSLKKLHTEVKSNGQYTVEAGVKRKD